MNYIKNITISTLMILAIFVLSACDLDVTNPNAATDEE
jgi:hypothetical protein